MLFVGGCVTMPERSTELQQQIETAENAIERGEYKKAAETIIGLTEYTDNPRDIQNKLSLVLLRHSASSGNTDSLVSLGRIYLGGKDVTQDYETALAFFEAAANAGDAEAKYLLGLMYYSGLGVVEDRQKARLLISEAAHKNFAKAQVEYGSLFLIGSGGTVDMTAALKWFRLAAKNGDQHANEYAELTEDIIQLSRIGNSARQASKRWMKVAIILALIEKNSQRDELEFIKKLQSVLKQNGAEFTSGEIRQIINRVTLYAEQRKEWIARQQEKAPQ